MTFHRAAALVAVSTALLALTACSATSAASSPAPATASGPTVDLSGTCPATVSVQTNWNPEAEHGMLYEMLGPNPAVDTSQKTVTGELMAGGKSAGVKLQLRAGGPAIGYQSVSSVMYQDKSITLGFVPTDEAIQNSEKLPTTAVFAQLQHAPAVIMWDPKTYAGVSTVPQLDKALQKSGGVVRYSPGSTYMTYLLGKGVLAKDVTSGDYQGSPAAFVVAKGKDAQQGYATAEPYLYEHEVSAWSKPVKYQLVSELGYDPYESSVSVRSGDLDKLGPCLQKLVPIMQHAELSYFAHPAATNSLITRLVTEYNNGWTYDANVADFAVKQMKALKLVGNGPSGYIGEMTDERVKALIDATAPTFTTGGAALKPGLAPSDLVTNEFLSTKVTF